MFKWLCASVLALSAAAAPAATFTFDYGAFNGDILAGLETSGTGSFDVAGDDGTFTLASGLDAFSLSGEESTNIFLSGTFALTAADLTSFSATLVGGVLTDLAFTTRVFDVDQLLFGFLDTGVPDVSVAYAVSGLAPGNFSFTVDGGDPITGDLTVQAAAVPAPATWGMMLLGFGLAGATLRRRTTRPALA